MTEKTTTIPHLGECVTLSRAAQILGISRQAAHQAIGLDRLKGTTRELAPGGYKITWVSLASVREYDRTRKPAP